MLENRAGCLASRPVFRPIFSPEKGMQLPKFLRFQSVESQARTQFDGVFNDGSWSELETKIGTAPSTVAFTHHQQDYDTLSELADYSWLHRRVVRLLPETAWQEEIVFADEKDREQWDKINAVEGNDDGAFLTAAILARTHGAALLIIGHTHTGSLETPLPEETADIEFLSPVSVLDYEVRDLDINKDQNDPLRFGLPEFYTISGNHRFRGARIHHSRIVHFTGPASSSTETMRDSQKIVTASVLDPVHCVIQDYGLTWASIESMLKQASVPVWKLAGLIKGLASDSKGIEARMGLMQATMSSQRAVMLDADGNEEYSRESADFADIPQIMQQLTLMVSAATCYPAQELFGRIISGLGDTGDNDSDKYMRQVSSYRTRTLAPRINQLMPGVEWSFKPLDLPTPKEHIEVVKAWWDTGALTDVEMRRQAEQALTLDEMSEAEIEELFQGTPEEPNGEQETKEETTPIEEGEETTDPEQAEGPPDPPGGEGLRGGAQSPTG